MFCQHQYRLTLSVFNSLNVHCYVVSTVQVQVSASTATTVPYPHIQSSHKRYTIQEFTYTNPQGTSTVTTVPCQHTMSEIHSNSSRESTDAPHNHQDSDEYHAGVTTEGMTTRRLWKLGYILMGSRVRSITMNVNVGTK